MTGNDCLSHISLATEDTNLVLTVFFVGGPVTGFVSLGSEPKPSIFPDPFFRRQDNYVTSGTVYTLVSWASRRAFETSQCFLPMQAPQPRRIALNSRRRES